jgi:hypothetical protein
MSASPAANTDSEGVWSMRTTPTPAFLNRAISAAVASMPSVPVAYSAMMPDVATLHPPAFRTESVRNRP